MRQVLSQLRESDHFGLAYDVLAPSPSLNNGDYETAREAWLSDCEKIAIAPDYARFYGQWVDSFAGDSLSSQREASLTSRLLVGHGNPSASEVGLTVHRTWGVPMIPGAALKGLTAHYVDAVYGGEAVEVEADFRRQAWNGPAESHGPGEHFGALFGASAADGTEEVAKQGLVVFHDALFVPGSAIKDGRDRPFARDVLTVHQKEYYRKCDVWPNDWDSPNPVGFITVRPNVRLLLAVTGPDGWRDLAMKFLLEALREWGAGAKTSLGYGRAEAHSVK